MDNTQVRQIENLMAVSPCWETSVASGLKVLLVDSIEELLLCEYNFPAMELPANG